MSQPLLKTYFQDRPGWVPSHLTTHWDPSPYAYQTEEELMPAGGPHGQLLGYLLEVLRVPLKNRQLMLLQDTFMLYRDTVGIQQRVAPDLLLMPWREEAPSAYNLDGELPPSFVAEVTSKKSHLKDLEKNVPFYFGLGIPSYLVIDAITSTNRPRKQIQLHLWRMVNGQVMKMAPDRNNRLAIPELGVSVSVWGRRFRFEDLNTGEVLQDAEELIKTCQAEADRAETEARRADAEAQRAETEVAARQAAEAELAKLKAFLANKGYLIP